MDVSYMWAPLSDDATKPVQERMIARPLVGFSPQTFDRTFDEPLVRVPFVAAQNPHRSSGDAADTNAEPPGDGEKFEY